MRERRAIKLDRPDERPPERPALSIGERSIFNLPQSFLEKHPEKRFSFVPYIDGGVELRDTYHEAVYDRNFECAFASTYPELNYRVSVSPFAKEDDDFIKVKGQILMVRSVEAEEAERAKYDEYNAWENYKRSTYMVDAHNPAVRQDDRSFSTQW